MAKPKSTANLLSETSATPFHVFPKLQPKSKSTLECQTILDDQILLLDSIFSPAECKAFIKFIDDLPLELTPPKRRGEASRVNYRYSISSVEFANTLQSILSPHLPSLPYPASKKPKNGSEEARVIHSFNSNIRLYRYTLEQYFGCHYDDSVVDPATHAKSEWTVLIYLTGVEDGIQGGETIFYHDSRGKKVAAKVDPRRGAALLHRHGPECLLHEGALVRAGTKYILRSDIMFL